MQTLPIKYDKGSGVPLVLLHGLGNNHKSWSFALGNIDKLSQRVIALDLLGFGDAPKPEAKYSVEEHAEAVIKTLDKHGIKNARMAGHSMGCVVAIEVASQRPDLVQKLVLFGAPLYRRKPRQSLLSKLTRSEGRYFTLFNIVKKNPDAVKAGGDIADELVPFVKGMEITDETWPAYKKSLENTIMQTASYKKVQKLDIPMLFVNGWLDFFIIRKNIKELRKKNPKNIKIKNVLGPHELTPAQGKLVGRILSSLE